MQTVEKLSDKQYRAKRKKELNAQHSAGTLPDDMRPYWKWLNGKLNTTNRIPHNEKATYYKARRKVNKYLKTHTQKEAIEFFDVYVALITRLQNKQFNKVSFTKADQIANTNIDQYE